MLNFGPDLDYFRFVADPERPEIQEAFDDAHGEQPASLLVYLPYADVERNWACWKEKWSAGGLVHRCDGETMTVWQDTVGQYQRTPRPCDGGCKPVGRLSLLLPELIAAGFVGYVVFESHSLNDILSIQASLLAAAEARKGVEMGLRGIPWTLRRAKQAISTPSGQGKRARREKWLVKIEPVAQWVQLEMDRAKAATLMLPAPSLQAPMGERVVDEDSGEIEYTDAGAGEIDQVPDAPEVPTPDPTPEPPPVAQAKPAPKTPASDTTGTVTGEPAHFVYDGPPRQLPAGMQDCPADVEQDYWDGIEHLGNAASEKAALNAAYADIKADPDVPDYAKQALHKHYMALFRKLPTKGGTQSAGFAG